MIDLYPYFGVVGALVVSLLAALWMFFRRRYRREEFPADAWDPYLDSREKDDADDMERGVEMISGGEEEDIQASAFSSSGESVTSRLKDLERFPPKKEKEPFGVAAEFPASPPESEYSGDVEPSYSPDEPEEETDEFEEREAVHEARGGGDDLSSSLSGESEDGSKEMKAGPAEGKSPWWKDAVSPKDRPFLRGVAELMGVTVLDSVANLEAAKTEQPETESDERVSDSEEAWMRDVAPEEASIADIGAEESADETLVLEDEVAADTAGGKEEAHEDVFSVIGDERADTPGDLPEEPIGSARLFDDLEDEESETDVEETEGVEEAVSQEAEDFVPLAEIVKERLTSEPMDVVASDAPESGEEAGEAVSQEEEAVSLLDGPPLERVRELVSEICPDDLPLIEEVPGRLPDEAVGVAASAWRELREQMEARKTIEPEEFLRLGILDQFLGRYDEAMTRLKEALRRTNRMGPVLNAMAVASYWNGKIDPAISYCKEAIREAGTDAALSAVVHRNVGFLYQKKGDFRQAAEALAAAIQYIGAGEDPRLLGGLHLRTGQLFRRLDEMDNARHHFSESAEFFGRSGDDMFRVRSLVALAASQTEQDDVGSALKNLNEAARLSSRAGDKAGEALTLGQMGIAYSEQDQYTRAIEHFEKALALNRELGNHRGEGASLSNIGNIHYFRGDLGEAQSAYEKALEINREQDHLIGQATILGNLGRIHLEQGEVEPAGECLRESQQIFRKAGARDQLERIQEMLEELDRAQNT